MPKESFGVKSGPTVKFEQEVAKASRVVGWRELHMYPLKSTFIGEGVWVVNLFVDSDEEIVVRKRRS